jgi:hypothetical protein
MMALGLRRGRQRGLLRITLGVAVGLLGALAVVCWLPWEAVGGLCRWLGGAWPAEHRAGVYLLRGAGGLAAWVAGLLCLPVANPRRYAGVIDVSIGMLVVLAVVAALLGAHLRLPAVLYLGTTIACGLLAATLGALRGAATFRPY